MRKMICLITALVICLSLGVTAFAAENEFVPSITYKPTPEIVPVENENGEEFVGVICGQDGEPISYVEAGCLQITPVAHLWDENKDVPEDVETLLNFVYTALNDGSMMLPYEKYGADLNASNMVVRDLFEVSWTCEEHKEMVEAEGVTFELTFNLGVVADAQIFVMTYDEAADEWSPIVNVVNNGDGSITCTFEHLCVVAVSVPSDTDGDANIDTGDNSNVGLWVGVMTVSAVLLAAVILVGKKKTAY